MAPNRYVLGNQPPFRLFVTPLATALSIVFPLLRLVQSACSGCCADFGTTDIFLFRYKDTHTRTTHTRTHQTRIRAYACSNVHSHTRLLDVHTLGDVCGQGYQQNQILTLGRQPRVHCRQCCWPLESGYWVQLLWSHWQTRPKPGSNVS